jgi:hypothetical protein
MVQLQILPKKEYRNPAGIELLRSKLKSAGLNFISAGYASISAEIDEVSFGELLGSKLRVIEPKPSGDRDFGAAGGYAADSAIVIPSSLAPWVESITIAPPFIRI